MAAATLAALAERVGDGETRSSLTATDLAALRGEIGWAPDDRRVSPGRVYVDARLAADRFLRGRGWSKTDRETAAADAVAWIARRIGEREPDLAARLEARLAARRAALSAPTPARQSLAAIAAVERLAAERGEIGAAMPLRREWLADDGRLSDAAWRTLRRAVNDCARSLSTTGAAPDEAPTDPIALGLLAEREAERRGEPEPESGAMDVDASELAPLLGLSRAASIALESRAAIALALGADIGPKDAAAMALDDLAERHDIARSRAASYVSTGAAELAERYPHPRELVQALSAAMEARRAIALDGLGLALSELASYPSAERRADALSALSEHELLSARRPAHVRALELAALRAYIRAGATGSAALVAAPDVARWISRLLSAEQARMRRLADRGARLSLAAPISRENGQQRLALVAAEWRELAPTRIGRRVDLSGASYRRAVNAPRSATRDGRARVDSCDHIPAPLSESARAAQDALLRMAAERRAQ